MEARTARRQREAGAAWSESPSFPVNSTYATILTWNMCSSHISWTIKKLILWGEVFKKERSSKQKGSPWDQSEDVGQ